MNRHSVVNLSLLAVAAGVFISRTTAAASDDAHVPGGPSPSVAIRQVELGFGGKYKLGCWTPIRVTLEASDATSGRLEVTVPDGDGVPTAVSSGAERPLQLSQGKAHTETLYIKIGQAGGAVEVEFLRDEQALGRRVFFPGEGGTADEIPRGLAATVRLFVVVGGEIGLAEALGVGEVDAAFATHFAVIGDAEELPEDTIGWDGVDEVVLNTSDAGLYLGERFADVRPALARWLQLGGRMYLFVGQNGEALLTAGGPLAEFVPGQFVRQEALLQPREIEDICDGQFRLPVSRGEFRLPVPYITDVDGRVLFQGGNLPLLVQAVRGFGRLTWIAMDVDRAPLSGWIGKPELLRRIFGEAKQAQSDVATSARRLTSLGYTDLVGQLRAALEVFPGIRTFEFAWVIGFTLLYLALLGPIDYFLVHRWGRRPVLTWLTLPFLVLLVAGGAYSLARGTKGRDVRLNQAEVVDFDLPTGLVRGAVWANLYSPEHDRFTLTFRPQAPVKLAVDADKEAVFSWMALPGKGMGGVEATADASSVERGYRFSLDRTRLEGLPLAIWSSKGLFASWSTHAAPPLTASLSAHVDDELAGTLTNGFDQELEDVRLYFRGRLCRLGSLKAGQAIQLNSETLWVSAGNELTGRTLSKDASPYDPAARDARRVLQMMMWFDLAGGANYVGLVNRYHARLDFGHLLDEGRAVLVAQSAGTGSRILREGVPVQDDKGLQLVVYRIVLPVERKP